MSDLNAILNAIALLSVTIPGETIKGVDTPENLKASYASADVPRRLLLPLGGNLDTEQGGAVSFGATPSQAILWRVTDLFLLYPVGQGRNLSQFMPALVRYGGAYADAAAQKVRLINNANFQRATLESWSFDYGVWAYPEGGETAYYGVNVTLHIRELS